MANVLDREDLARRLGVTAATVGRWARAGRIPEIVVGPKTRRYDYYEVLVALKARSNRTNPVPPTAETREG